MRLPTTSGSRHAIGRLAIRPAGSGEATKWLCKIAPDSGRFATDSEPQTTAGSQKANGPPGKPGGPYACICKPDIGADQRPSGVVMPYHLLRTAS